MNFSLRVFSLRLATGLSIVVSALLLNVAVFTSANAESAYIDQARSTSLVAPIFNAPKAVQSKGISSPFVRSQAANFSTTPEMMSVPRSGGNFAQTLEMGSYNQVLQFQHGANNRSNVGVLGGKKDTVGVFQSGQNLVSNMVLLNASGLSVGVIQPPGSAPVNMLIMRLPKGGLLIKR